MLNEIDAYLRRHRMAPTAFGRAAANDPRLVFDIREGRELRSKTQKRIRAYMEGNP